MKKETKEWLEYADENLQSAKILLDNHLYNPSLQNVQQTIKKYLKAVCIEYNLGLLKTHSIFKLKSLIEQELNISLNISDEEIDLIDSIYLSSKYPVGSVLPDFMPDENICKKSLNIAKNLKEDIFRLLEDNNYLLDN